MKPHYSLLNCISTIVLIMLFCAVGWAQEDKKKSKGISLKSDRSFQLKTTEATWIPLDVSPDGKQIVFSVLGDLYLLPITGGKAKRITQGLAFDTHPRFSPDGKSLAFSSDRDGNGNVWILDLKTKDTVQVTKEKKDKIGSVEWTPDGDYLVVSKGGRVNKLYLFHKGWRHWYPTDQGTEALEYQRACVWFE